MKLKGITSIGEYTLLEQLESNLISYFNWGVLQAGGFFNTEEELTLLNDPAYTAGTVYAPSRLSIVWETGLGGYTPQIPEVSVNGVVVSNYKIDYTKGYIIFNSAPSGTVTMKYAYRFFNFVDADKPWYKKIVETSYTLTDTTSLDVAKLLSDNTVQLPVVIIENDPRRYMDGYQLGGGKRVLQDVKYTIFAENEWGRDKMIDIITYQIDRTIPFYDLNKVAADNVLPFNDDGTLNSSRLSYEQLISSHKWKKATFKEFSVQQTLFSPPIYQAQIRGTVEIIMGQL